MQAEIHPTASGTRPGMLRRIVGSTPVRLVLGLAMLGLVPFLLSYAVRFGRRAWPAFDAAVRASPQVSSLHGRLLAFYMVAGGIVLLAPQVYRLFVRWTERRPAAELGLAGAGAELARGLLLGASMFSCAILILWSGGHYQVADFNGVAVLPPIFVMSASAAVLEELLFRGVIFRLLEQSLGTRLALAISALLFGLVHLGNPNASLLTAAAIALEAGVLLGAAYMLTRRLWLVMGVHFAWNFTQGGIFGVPVSGIRVPGLLEGQLSGPEWLTGGAFGVEASVAALAVSLAFTVLVLRAARERHGHLAPFWRRAQ